MNHIKKISEWSNPELDWQDIESTEDTSILSALKNMIRDEMGKSRNTETFKTWALNLTIEHLQDFVDESDISSFFSYLKNNIQGGDIPELVWNDSLLDIFKKYPDQIISILIEKAEELGYNTYYEILSDFGKIHDADTAISQHVQVAFITFVEKCFEEASN